MVEPKLVDLIRENNCPDVALGEFGKTLFEPSLLQNEKRSLEGLKALRTNPNAADVEELWTIDCGAGRFLLSKIASAL
jgi:hypothetical protein